MEKNYEVRLTCVNHSVFAVRIDSEDKLDWRKNYAGLKYSVIECPHIIINRCFKLMEDFGLKFGAFDFIVNKSDEWIFLEINPNGQWLWLEKCIRHTNFSMHNSIFSRLMCCNRRLFNGNNKKVINIFFWDMVTLSGNMFE